MDIVDYDNITPRVDYFVFRNCSPSWYMVDSVTDYIDLTYIIKGNVTYTINGICYKAEKGDLICIPKNSHRRAVMDLDNPISVFAANFKLFNLNGKEVALPFPVCSKVDIRNDLIKMYQELNTIWTQKDPGYAMLARSHFMQILHTYFMIFYYKNYPECSDPRIQNIIRFIYDNYEANLEVEDLASLCGLNSSYFGLLFKKNMGISVKEYINQVRIDNAESMLSSGQFSIVEVARRCGFEDISYFSKVFKGMKGFPPSKVAINIYLDKSKQKV